MHKDHFICNKYEELKSNGDTSLLQEERRIADAKTELDKYLFYFERFNNHAKAEKLGRDLLPAMRVKMQELHDK